ncbi:MAG: T9SS type A sorting domain-containing protein [Lewinellaceae bacterium]|nr:T9SS type A sorting domain-containing protein [Lewinellaceae bacterium]
MYQYVNITGLDEGPLVSIDPDSSGFGLGNGGGASLQRLGWQITSSSQNALDAGNYLEFVLTPITGYSLNINSVSMQLKRDGAGPQKVSLRGKIGNGAWSGDLGNTASINAINFLPANFSFTGFSNITQTVRFRILGYDANTTDGKLFIDNLGFGPSSSLPVELVRFNAVQQDHGAMLNWSTASESNSNYFSIERSSNGTGFRPIGTVTAARNSIGFQQYSFFDERPAAGTNYYRLNMVDQDGSSAYSPVQAIDLRNRQVVQCYPYFCTDWVNLKFATPSEERIPWTIVSAKGRQMLSGTLPADAETASLPVDQLPPGTYLIVLQYSAGRQTLRFGKI